MSRPAQAKPVGKSSKICLCIYGPSGIGKTTLVGSGAGKVLIVRSPLDHTHVLEPGSVDEWVVNDWESINSVQEAAKAGELDDYDWVWADTITLMSDEGLDDIAEQLFVKKPHRKEHGLDKGEYGVNMERLGQWVRVMAGVPGFHFGVTAHPMERDDLVHDGLLLGPQLQGKNMSGKLCSYMDIVGYYHLVKTKQGERRVLRTNLTTEYFAKDQLKIFNKGRMADPTMAKIMTAITAKHPHLAGGTTRTRPRRRRRAK